MQASSSNRKRAIDSVEEEPLVITEKDQRYTQLVEADREHVVPDPKKQSKRERIGEKIIVQEGESKK